jgi:hypothetical protein
MSTEEAQNKGYMDRECEGYFLNFFANQSLKMTIKE